MSDRPAPEATPGWRLFAAGYIEGRPLLVGGVNVWNVDWPRTGEVVTVIDPLHGAPHTFPLIRIETPDGPAEFVAGEFANGAWGFYVPDTGDGG